GTVLARNAGDQRNFHVSIAFSGSILEAEVLRSKNVFGPEVQCSKISAIILAKPRPAPLCSGRARFSNWSPLYIAEPTPKDIVVIQNDP
ncbi:hypothetical protein, partial [Pseudorhizobium pelagicum]|uniref:hypothetical protein n=1 Tax=Pseudorhizobium pelagicum TaxID=1509405 RepID=UPI001AEC270E